LVPRPSPTAVQHGAAVPLCIDLDGTLIRTDLLWESFLLLLRENPRAAAGAILHLGNRAVLKRYIASRVTLDPAALPYQSGFLDWLKAQRLAGRTLVLATASDEILARRVAGHLGIFDHVIASDGSLNLKASAKADALSGLYPEGFDYAGNSSADLPVWEKARNAVVVDAAPAIDRRLRGKANVETSFPSSAASRLRAWMKAVRVHQWSKSFLVFVPIITSHRWADFSVWFSAAAMFAALALSASALYIVNDLLDLEADRRHLRKRNRPFASGAIPIPSGIVAAIACLACGLAVASVASPLAIWTTAAYAALSGLYSFVIKRHAPADVFFLASLYVLRIIAGGVAAGIHVTEWLLAFALFLFLGLAFCKRAAELATIRVSGSASANGRSYTLDDLQLITGYGIASSSTAALVLVLYLNSDQMRSLYRHPAALWLLAPLTLFWQVRTWMLTLRGDMHDDPIAFAVRDRMTWVLGVLAILLVLISR
jgi:4-hydroxybenzoate polyprenyltransferase/phosphoserine phosphatase